MKTLDLSPRCARVACKKLIRQSKRGQSEYARYQPFCSYSCQEWGHLEAAQAHLNSLRKQESRA